MLSNYLKIAVRNLRRQPGYAFINIAGLAVGIASCLLIGLFVYHEFSFDRFHERSDRIYRVLTAFSRESGTQTLARTPLPMADALDRTFPSINRTVRLRPDNGIVRQDDLGRFVYRHRRGPDI